MKIEMKQLNNYLLHPTPIITNLLHLTSHISVALLITRSINIKLPDINQDNSLKSAHVVCFMAETWSNSLYLADQVIVRNDHDTANNNKGSVVIATHTTIQDLFDFPHLIGDTSPMNLCTLAG